MFTLVWSCFGTKHWFNTTRNAAQSLSLFVRLFGILCHYGFPSFPVVRLHASLFPTALKQWTSDFLYNFIFISCWRSSAAFSAWYSNLNCELFKPVSTDDVTKRWGNSFEKKMRSLFTMLSSSSIDWLVLLSVQGCYSILRQQNMSKPCRQLNRNIQNDYALSHCFKLSSAFITNLKRFFIFYEIYSSTKVNII